MARFFVQARLAAGETVSLSGERAHYMSRVLRHKLGDHLHCFDGSGSEFECVLSAADHKACSLEVLRETRRGTPRSPRLHVALPLLKGQAMDRALQQATELGASNIWLIETRRSNVHLSGSRLDNKMAHWSKVVVASTEQSGGLFLPSLTPPTPLGTLLDETTAEAIAFHPRGSPFPMHMERAERLVLIGPEGGWDPAEIELFSASKVVCLSLGDRILRAETAPGVTLALVQHAEGALGEL